MLNRSRSLWRRRRRGVEHPLAVLPEPASPADVARDVTNVAVLGDALRKLGPRQRAVLYLRYYEDLSEAETAQTLGCSVGTVKRQTHDALGRLRVLAPELSPTIEPSEVNE
jgi:RNA polymerase sigma factor (sigma-70 family)